MRSDDASRARSPTNVIPICRPVVNKTQLISFHSARHVQSRTHRSTTSSSSHVHLEEVLITIFQGEPVQLGLLTTWVTHNFFRTSIPTMKPLGNRKRQPTQHTPQDQRHITISHTHSVSCLISHLHPRTVQESRSTVCPRQRAIGRKRENGM